MGSSSNHARLPRIAVLHQDSAPPSIDGIVKPPKPGGYRDSAADIAFALQGLGATVHTPAEFPLSERDLDWSFPDTETGIEQALGSGAEVLWVNSTLHSRHPLVHRIGTVGIIGHSPWDVERNEDKWAVQSLLRAQGIPVPAALRVSTVSPSDTATAIAAIERGSLRWPIVVKPIRGRGSQGVHRATDPATLLEILGQWPRETYGAELILEEYLEGAEYTVAVLPPGSYSEHGEERSHTGHWALPPVLRTGHQAGIAPYSGEVPVRMNSAIAEDLSPELQQVLRYCAEVARLLRARAVIRIDCRTDAHGDIRLFDVNLKPNMTGPGRPGRDGQDSLVAIAAAGLGWDFQSLIVNLARQWWR